MAKIKPRPQRNTSVLNMITRRQKQGPHSKKNKKFPLAVEDYELLQEDISADNGDLDRRASPCYTERAQISQCACEIASQAAE